MPIADWTVPFELTSQVFAAPTLPLNQAIAFTNGTGYYRLKHDSCQLTNTVRETKDFVPQAPGAILHRRFAGGMEMALVVQLWAEGTIACDELLQEMVDDLMGYLYGLLNAVDDQGRISWTPVGYPTRMLDNLRLLTYPTGTQSPNNAYEVAFSLDTEYPYAEDLTQITTPMTDAVTVTVNNTGTAPTYPVFKVYGACVVFTLQNLTTGLNYLWIAGNPGSQLIPGGSYGEVSMFGNTIFMNGDQANLSPGVDMVSSEYFPLVPGNNDVVISTSGPGCDMLWNPAWA